MGDQRRCLVLELVSRRQVSGILFLSPPPLHTFPSLCFLPDQFCVSVQHRQDPDDKTASLHHIRDHPVQVWKRRTPWPDRHRRSKRVLSPEPLGFSPLLLLVQSRVPHLPR